MAMEVEVQEVVAPVAVVVAGAMAQAAVVADQEEVVVEVVALPVVALQVVVPQELQVVVPQELVVEEATVK